MSNKQGKRPLPVQLRGKKKRYYCRNNIYFCGYVGLQRKKKKKVVGKKKAFFLLNIFFGLEGFLKFPAWQILHDSH